MLRFLLKKRVQKIVAWSLLVMFIPGFSAIAIAHAFENVEFRVPVSCFPGETVVLQPFPNVEKIF
jgi:hypothetical protein